MSLKEILSAARRRDQLLEDLRAIRDVCEKSWAPGLGDAWALDASGSAVDISDPAACTVGLRGAEYWVLGAGGLSGDDAAIRHYQDRSMLLMEAFNAVAPSRPDVVSCYRASDWADGHGKRDVMALIDRAIVYVES